MTLGIIIVVIITIIGVVFGVKKLKNLREDRNYDRAMKMVTLMIHLPPTTDDIQGGGRDERDVTNEAISEAQVMYSILSSTLRKDIKAWIYNQKHFSFEMVVKDGFVKYFAVVPIKLVDTAKQAIVSSYPTARLEESDDENFFSEQGKINGIAGGELSLKKEYCYPIATYEETKWDAQAALLNAFSKVKTDEGMGVQVMFRPVDARWAGKSKELAERIKDGKSTSNNFALRVLHLMNDLIRAPFEPPEAHEYDKESKSLTQLQQEEIAAIENKTKFPAFECLIRFVASAASKPRAEALLGGVVAAFAQFDSPTANGFRYEPAKDVQKLVEHYIFRIFPQTNRSMVLNSVELSSIYHLPSQNSIPSSGVERQLTKQVDGPARLVTDGVLIGINEYRGEKKEIRLSVDDRRRHAYVIGSTGMGKSVFLRNIAYQDMMEGRGFAFIDPHGDVVEELLAMVPPERIDDVIYFDPSDVENPIGMNMFEYQTPDQMDFIVQEGINMLQSLYDPNNQGYFGARGQHMFRNAAILLMSDPAGATFIDIPRCFIDPQFVKSKLKYLTDRNVYDYWTKEFPASQKSSDAGEVITWFSSKWGPFISNLMMKNTLGQIHSGFNIREVMDQKKILLVNLSKGKLGELNSKLLGMIFVMKFQTAAMSRVDTPEDERNDFCLFVDEFQNYSTESFESILSEARKFRLNLIVANQFMTQLTDKIREGVIGNVGTIVAGRLGVTDAELMEKVFTPTFNAEDLHKTPNHNAIATVMMHGMPSTPFTMTWPMLGKGNPEVGESLKLYSATKYGRPAAEVEREINERMSKSDAESASKAKPVAPTQPDLAQPVSTEQAPQREVAMKSAQIASSGQMPQQEVPIVATEQSARQASDESQDILEAMLSTRRQSMRPNTAQAMPVVDWQAHEGDQPLTTMDIRAAETAPEGTEEREKADVRPERVNVADRDFALRTEALVRPEPEILLPDEGAVTQIAAPVSSVVAGDDEPDELYDEIDEPYDDSGLDEQYDDEGDVVEDDNTLKSGQVIKLR